MLRRTWQEQTRLRHEKSKLQFENKRITVERLEKKSEYDREMRQQEIDRKDEQARQLHDAKVELRERRARQSRDFFVQQRQMADKTEKELQYLRFFGRPKGASLNATRKQFESQVRKPDSCRAQHVHNAELSNGKDSG